MNSTASKTYCCKASGCGISFINEGQLNLHEKKHDMILNIEHKTSNVFLADQTPTPTRLIKNCEEVGLFDDLRNVNPFDETFRRAVETTNQSADHLTIHKNTEHLLNEDTLHTPQVFPNQNETAETTNVVVTEQFQIEKQKIILSNNLDKKHKKIDDNFNAGKSTKRQKSLTEIVLISNASKTTNIRPAPAPATTNDRLLLPSLSNTTINLIQPQNITWQTSKTLILPKPVTTNNNNKTQIISVKEKLKTILSNNQDKKKSKLITNTTGTAKLSISSATAAATVDDDCLERRRAAANRYRKKKHNEQCQLAKQNAQLIAENLELKSTIQELQQILLAHSNCDLTQNTLKNSPNGITAQLLIKSMPSISIPASTIVMNIPKLIIQSTGGHAQLLHQ